jgi:hypothetical protein
MPTILTPQKGSDATGANMDTGISDKDTAPSYSPLLEMVRSTGGIDLAKKIAGRYMEDPLFHSIQETPSDFKNIKFADGLIHLKDNRRCVLCIP